MYKLIEKSPYACKNKCWKWEVIQKSLSNLRRVCAQGLANHFLFPTLEHLLFLQAHRDFDSPGSSNNDKIYQLHRSVSVTGTTDSP
jgi:hypothetical protein